MLFEKRFYLRNFMHRFQPHKGKASEWVTFVALLFWGVSIPVVAQQRPQMDLERVKISAGMNLITAQVALTPEQRQIGLMYREKMSLPEGMIFVFDQPAQQCFWMKNTLLPLTAAFVADDGRIVNLADMKPQTLDPTALKSRCATSWR